MTVTRTCAALLFSLAASACSRRPQDQSPPAKDAELPLTPSGTREDPRALPTYAVRRLTAGDAIVIDGKLDEPTWTATTSTRAFVHPGTGKRIDDNSPLGGTLRLRYDAEALYVAIEARARQVRGSFAPNSTDPHLWTEDTVEIMLDPDGDGDNRDYYEIQINPQGLVFDAQFDDYNQPRGGPNGPFGHQDFDSGVRRAVTVLGTLNDPTDVDRGYVVEAAVPFRNMTKARRIPPQRGDEWRANFYVMQDNGGVSWSPILGQGNFHKASRFGRLRFD